MSNKEFLYLVHVDNERFVWRKKVFLLHFFSFATAPINAVVTDDDGVVLLYIGYDVTFYGLGDFGHKTCFLVYICMAL